MLHNNFPYHDPLQPRDQSQSIRTDPPTQIQKDLQSEPQIQASSIVDLGSEALPSGWERVIDQEHGVYYIDHNTKRTQYERPYEVELTKGAMGFGFTLVEADSGLLLVRSVIPGGPAYMNGTISPGDILISAVGVSVTGIQHTDIARLFSTFAVGDRVRLTFARSNYVLDDKLIPDEYLFSNGTNGDLAIAVNPKNQIAANDYGQCLNGQVNQSSQILVDDEYEFVTVTLRRGDQGFGFTISDSIAGQKVRRIQNHDVCANLRQGDILISLNERDITKLTHKEVVEELKRCPAGMDVTLVVKRKKRFRSKTPHDLHSYHNKSDFSLDAKPRRNCKTPSLDGLMLNRLNNRDAPDLPSEGSRMQADLNPDPVCNQQQVPNTADYVTYDGLPVYGLTESSEQQSNPYQNQLYSRRPIIGEQQPIYCNQNDTNITSSDLNNAPRMNDTSNGLDYNTTINNPMNTTQHIEPSYIVNKASPGNLPAGHLGEFNQYDALSDKFMMMQVQQQSQPYIPYPPASNYHDVPLYSNSDILNDEVIQTYGLVPSLPSKPPVNQISYFQAPNDSYQCNFYANNEEIAQQKVQYDLASSFQPLIDQHQNILQAPLMLRSANDQLNYVQSSMAQDTETPYNENDEYEYYHVELTRENTDSNWGIRLIGGAEVDRAISIGSMIFGGVAAKSGKLKSGDEIISIDHNSVVGATHQHVVEMISARTNRVQLVVRRKRFAEACDVVLTKNMDEGFGFVIISSENCALIGKIIPGSPADRCKQLRVRDCIIAVNGRYITPDMKHPELVNMIKECGSTLRLRIIPVDCYTVKIIKDTHNDSFGFRMRGGSEYDGTPLYIVRVEVNGQAHGLLNVGDQILEINNIPTIGMTHSQAATIIKYSDPAVKLKLRRNFVTPPSLLVDSPRALQKYNQVTAEMKAVSLSLPDSREELTNQNGIGASDRGAESHSSLPADIDCAASEQLSQNGHPALVGVLDDGLSDQRYPMYEHHPMNYLDDSRVQASSYTSLSNGSNACYGAHK